MLFESPILIGFLIFVGWFFVLWGCSFILTEVCGMVAKYAYPSALLIAAVPATIAIWVCYDLNPTGYTLGATGFLIVCLWISGGL